MRGALSVLVVAALAVGVGREAARACGGYGDDPTALAIKALSEDKAEAARAVRAMRAMGPAGLEALTGTYQSAIDRHRANPAKPEAMWGRLSAALDAVAAQRDAWAAGLYWYTDLEQAKRAAKASGKPILSLRLLGTLDSEFSCANSRFFRTALYPNAQVGKALREGFVLHWQSHRPVPRLTIDFGDGRTIERTITGNSVHYVLTPDGRAVDVIPGLYGPAAFVRVLAEGKALASHGGREIFPTILRDYHQAKSAEVRQAWARDLARVGVAVPVGLNRAARGQAARPTAVEATRITVAKSAMEAAPVAALLPNGATLASAAGADEGVWAKIAALHPEYGALDAGSRAVVASKVGAPDAVAANRVTASKMRVEDPVTRMVRNFERSVAEDTVRNEYAFHSQIHDWFARGEAPAALDDLNERVYAELFLMPKGDPWLGLVPAEAYTGLPAGK